MIRTSCDNAAIAPSANLNSKRIDMYKRIRPKAEKIASEQYAQTYVKNPELYMLLRDLESIQASFESGGHVILPMDERPFKTLFFGEKSR